MLATGISRLNNIIYGMKYSECWLTITIYGALGARLTGG